MSKTDNNALYCGIDLHSRSATIALKDQNGKVIRKAKTPNELPRVLDLLDPYQANIQAIAIESTFNWYWLVDGLMEKGYAVQLANPAAFEQYSGIKNANDNTDAIFLAEMLRLGILPTGYIYPKQERVVRDLLRRRMLLVQKRTSIKLSLGNLFARHTGKMIPLPKLLTLSPIELSERLKADDVLLFTAQEQIDLIAYLNRVIKRCEDKVLSETKLRPEFKIIQTIPGVGPILGLVIMLEIGDINRFKKSGNLTSYCRCVKAIHTSAGKIKKHNNRKNGNKYLSWAFVEAGHGALSCCEPARRFYQRKKSQTGKGAIASKALAAKLSKAAFYMLKNQEAFCLAKVF